MAEGRLIPGSIGERLDALVVVLDERGVIIHLNAFGERLTGYSSEEVRGRNWFEVFIPEMDQEEIQEMFDEIWSGGDLYSGTENPILTKDGRQLLIRWENFLMRNEDGAPQRIVTIGVDITDGS